MKYLKKYEGYNDPDIGDYIITTDSNGTDLNDFLSSNIGILNDIQYVPDGDHNYVVLYNNIPDKYIKIFDDVNDRTCYPKGDTGVLNFDRHEILHHSKDKSKLAIDAVYMLDGRKKNQRVSCNSQNTKFTP